MTPTRFPRRFRVILGRFASGVAGLCAVAATACTIHQTTTPSPSGPAEFALSIGITTTPDIIMQDGVSQSVVTVSARDVNGRPLASVSLQLDMVIGGVVQSFGTLSSSNIVTGSNGQASTVYTAPPPPPPAAGSSGTIIMIRATPIGSDYQTSVPQSAQIRLVPPGVILPPAGTPTASFLFSPATPTANAQVQFDASASQPGTGAQTITSYTWSFGDGSSASGRTATHTFTTVGTFSVTLTITNDRALSASTTQQVIVAAGAAPTAAFVYSPTPVVPGSTVNFDANGSTASPGHTLVQYIWDWGDGTPTVTGGLPLATHVFAAVGSYTVVLTVVDDIGQRGATSVGVSVASGSPTASFTTAVTNALTHTVQANGGASTAVGTATISTYAWSWGDGATVSGSAAVVSHSYGGSGTYTVQLTVTDSLGRSGSTQTSVTVP